MYNLHNFRMFFSKRLFIRCGKLDIVKMPNILFTSQCFVDRHLFDKHLNTKQIANYSTKNDKNDDMEKRIIELENKIEILKNKNGSFVERINMKKSFDVKSVIKGSVKSVNEYVNSIKFDLNYPLFKNELFYFSIGPGLMIGGGFSYLIFNEIGVESFAAIGLLFAFTSTFFTPFYVARTLYRTFSKLDYGDPDAKEISNIYKIRFNNILCDNKIHLKDVYVKDYLTIDNCKVATKLDPSNLKYVPYKYRPRY